MNMNILGIASKGLTGLTGEVYKFLREVGAGTVAHEMVKKGGERVMETIADPKKLRQRFMRCLAALESPQGGDNLRNWHKRTRPRVKDPATGRWIPNTNRLLVGGQKIRENTFIKLMGEFEGSDRQVVDLMRLLDQLPEDQFCDYLDGLWNNAIAQTAEGFAVWFLQKKGFVVKWIDGTTIRLKRSVGKTKRRITREVLPKVQVEVKKARRTTKRRVRKFTQRVNQAAAEQELHNAIWR